MTEHTHDTPDAIEKQVILKAPRARVWEAIADSSKFGVWFGMKIQGPFVAGTKVQATIAPTQVDPEIAKHQEGFDGMPFELAIETVEPETRFAFRWHPYAVEPGANSANEKTTLVTFVLEDTPEGVLLTVTESGFHDIPLERRAKAFTANEGGWAIQTMLIGKYLAQTS